MGNWRTLTDIRREYGELELNESDVAASPIAQFEKWLTEILQTAIDDPTAMVLSTVDAKGIPDSRVVLLKAIENDAFVFYTNYRSAKASQIETNSHVALNFYWPQLARQVRVRGVIKKVDTATSDEYFATRPKLSQLSAIVSAQSQKITCRDSLEAKLNLLIAENQEFVVRPSYWGGYRVLPHEIEFWQGRDNRLHDRIHYRLKDENWTIRRLAP